MSDLGNKLAERAQSTSTAVEKSNGNGRAPTIRDLIEKQKGEIARALPKHMDADRLARVALTVIRTSPQLAKCTPESLLGAVMTSAALGLEPGPLGHAYLVPFGREVTFIVGYKGLIELARRSGNIETIIAREVYEHDKFEVAYGLEDRLVHEPALFGERGKVIAYYAVAKYRGGGHAFVVMTRSDVEKRRKASKAKDTGPWRDHFDEMAKKTCVRALAKYLPLSVEASRALAQDESVHHGVVAEADLDGDAGGNVVDADSWEDDEPDPDDDPDGPGGGVDPGTGEILDADSDVVDGEVVEPDAAEAAPEPAADEREAEDAHPKAVASFAREVRKAFPGESRPDLAKLRAGLLLHVTMDRTADTDECTVAEIVRATSWANSIVTGQAEHFLDGDVWRFRPKGATAAGAA